MLSARSWGAKVRALSSYVKNPMRLEDEGA